MKNKLKKFCLILTICISLCSVNVTAFAMKEYVDGYLRYTVEDGSVTITGYNGKESEVTIPSKIAGVPVNTIASGAFSNSTRVTKVNLPDTIMTIEEGAFRVGQTVVYNSNTNDTTITEPEDTQTKPSEKPGEDTQIKPSEKPGEDTQTRPSEKPGEDTSKEPSEKPGEDTEKEPSEKPGEDTQTKPVEKPGEDIQKEPTENPSENTQKEKPTENDFGVEEIEVELDVSESDDFVNDKADTETDENSQEQDTENGTETITTGSTDSTKKDNKIVPIIMVTVIAGMGIAGVYLYQKKGQR
uniref:hypothetical protein n=1 Tax=Agathobacter sp. TaxID=2021311 RepID=UPI004056DEEA